jgi:hypothetical protein
MPAVKAILLHVFTICYSIDIMQNVFLIVETVKNLNKVVK